MSEQNSCRWRSWNDADVDAYRLVDGNWLLFAYIKNEKLAHDARYWESVAGEFKLGSVLAVGRSLKTESGSEPLSALRIGVDRVPEELWCREGWMRFRLEAEKVLNPGLFLDQQYNRQRLIELIQGALARQAGKLSEADGVLNLFSYTGSFSIAAFCAGALSTTSVDVSSRYLAWEKQNFDANFGGHDLKHRLIKDDARDFLRRAAQRGSRYRWIIIDPPTFSRGQGKVFKVQDEIIELAEHAVSCLTPGGAVLVSTNDARWDSRKFFETMDQLAESKGLGMDRGTFPAEFGKAHPLKSVWLLSVG